jgi:tRNA 2-thiouridine synthesizing protein B
MLHIVNKSPLERPTLDSVVRLARSGALLLIEDAVYAATKGNAAEPKLREAMTKLKVYALMPDLQARGMADRLVDGVATVDYDGFVDLVAEHPNCQSWL